jgi:hypothetical protein
VRELEHGHLADDAEVDDDLLNLGEGTEKLSCFDLGRKLVRDEACLSGEGSDVRQPGQ